jgi:hypothetical protein
MRACPAPQHNTHALLLALPELALRDPVLVAPRRLRAAMGGCERGAASAATTANAHFGFFFRPGLLAADVSSCSSSTSESTYARA